MQKIVVVYKPVGLTPLQVVNQFRITNPDLAKVKIGYAGRLDPLAHGVLLLMLGEETKNKDIYLALPKKYEFTACFGLQTDTYDALGLLQNKVLREPDKNVNIFVNSFVNKYHGKLMMHYPPFSSKTVHGKPLFWWTRNNKLTEIVIPKKEIEIFAFRLLSIEEITSNELRQKIETNIKAVQGDFRQKNIMKQWNHLFAKIDKSMKLKTATFSITCSSGTYVRELVNLMGQELGCGAFALDIFRTAVGEFSVETAKRITS